MIVDSIECNNYDEYKKLVELETSFMEKVERIKKKLDFYESKSDIKYEN